MGVSFPRRRHGRRRSRHWPAEGLAGCPIQYALQPTLSRPACRSCLMIEASAREFPPWDEELPRSDQARRGMTAFRACLAVTGTTERPGAARTRREPGWRDEMHGIVAH